MKYKIIGKSGIKASVLGLGALHFGTFIDEKQSAKIINRALDLGINFIETSPIYGAGKSETIVGKAIKERRKEVIISTKVGLKAITRQDETFGNEVERLTKEHIYSSIEKSLRALGTDYVDLYQVHAFDHNTPIEETIDAMDCLIKEGKTRIIGCSNYDDTEFKLAYNAAVKNKKNHFSLFQVHHNLIERRAEDSVFPLCRQNNVGLIINRALARGILTGKYKNNMPIPENSRAKISNRVRRWLEPDMLKLVEELETFAQGYNRNAAELAIAWLLLKKEIAIVLFGARNIEQLENNINAVNWRLSKNDRNEIENIIKQSGLMQRIKSRPQTFFEK